MEPYQTLIAQGGLGLLAGIFFWLYMQERKDRKDLQTKVDALHEARRLDAVETRTDVTSVLPGISQTLQNIYDKIEVSKQANSANNKEK